MPIVATSVSVATNKSFASNCFDVGLLAWGGNTDIQLVPNYYKAVTYMCSNLPKKGNIP